MAILEVPKEEITIVWRIDFDVAMEYINPGIKDDKIIARLPSMHFQERAIRLARQRLDIVICCGLLCHGDIPHPHTCAEPYASRQWGRKHVSQDRNRP